MEIDCYLTCPCGISLRTPGATNVHRGAANPKCRGCRWLRAPIAARELDALGEHQLARRLCENMTPQQAAAFSDELAATADRLERMYADVDPKPLGAGWSGSWDAGRQTMIWDSYSMFEDAIREIRRAARAFGIAACCGPERHAWY